MRPLGDRVFGRGHGRFLTVGLGGWVRAGRCRSPLRGLRHVVAAAAVSGCSHSPTLDLLGSYFPAWMLCAAVGVVAAIILRQLLAVAGIGDYVVAPLLTYAAFAVSATFFAWLMWFGH
jgi:hypothetical protein